MACATNLQIISVTEQTVLFPKTSRSPISIIQPQITKEVICQWQEEDGSGGHISLSINMTGLLIVQGYLSVSTK